MENEDLTNLIETDTNTMITYETGINKRTVDIEDDSLDCDTTVTKKRKRSLKTNSVKWKREVTKKKQNVWR